MLAIIGGTGLTQLSNLKVLRCDAMSTPYGDPSSPLVFGQLGDEPVIFLARHGTEHTVAPHEINYRANLWALKHAQASHIVAIASVGGIRMDLVPISFMVPDQIIDYTYGRKNTFYECGEAPVTHIDFTMPYDQALRHRLLAAAVAVGEHAVDGGVYAAMQGPRLETAAEINRLERDGADIVGMTGMPEAALARELGLPYAALCIVANYAAGRGESSHALQFSDIEAAVQLACGRVHKIIEQLLLEP